MGFLKLNREPFTHRIKKSVCVSSIIEIGLNNFAGCAVLALMSCKWKSSSYMSKQGRRKHIYRLTQREIPPPLLPYLKTYQFSQALSEPRRLGFFDPRSGDVGFVMRKMTLALVDS
jgi:hypothetical protein